MDKQDQGKRQQDHPVADKLQQESTGPAERLVTGLAGAAFEGVEKVEGGIAAIWNFNKAVLRTAGGVTEPLRKPLDVLGVTKIVQRPVQAITQGVEETVTRLEEKGRAGLAQTGQLTVEVLGSTIDGILEYLMNNPKVDQLIQTQLERVAPLLANHTAIRELVGRSIALALLKLKDDPELQALVQAQAGAYIKALQTDLDPTLQALIRQQGDAYIDYLNAHPTAVQTLVQGQSMSLANDVMNEVRERTVTADTVVEMIVRRLLGRPPRAELPTPPEEVQRRAETSRLPSDFFVAAAPAEQSSAKQLPPTNGHA